MDKTEQRTPPCIYCGKDCGKPVCPSCEERENRRRFRPTFWDKHWSTVVAFVLLGVATGIYALLRLVLFTLGIVKEI